MDPATQPTLSQAAPLDGDARTTQRLSGNAAIAAKSSIR